jgi:chemotaxis signal transduction protein
MPINSPAIVLNNPTALSDRYLLAEVGRYTLVLPAIWVLEVFQVDLCQVLQMPQYPAAMLGVVHHQNSFISLLAGWHFLPVPQPNQVDKFTVVHLGWTGFQEQNLGKDLGLVVDRVVGSMGKEKFPKLASPDLLVMANPDFLSANIWQPLEHK